MFLISLHRVSFLQQNLFYDNTFKIITANHIYLVLTELLILASKILHSSQSFTGICLWTYFYEFPGWRIRLGKMVLWSMQCLYSLLNASAVKTAHEIANQNPDA